MRTLAYPIGTGVEWSFRKKVDEQQAKQSRDISQFKWISDFSSGHGAKWTGACACEKTGRLSEQGRLDGQVREQQNGKLAESGEEHLKCV